MRKIWPVIGIAIGVYLLWWSSLQPSLPSNCLDGEGCRPGPSFAPLLLIIGVPVMVYSVIWLILTFEKPKTAQSGTAQAQRVGDYPRLRRNEPLCMAGGLPRYCAP